MRLGPFNIGRLPRASPGNGCEKDRRVTGTTLQLTGKYAKADTGDGASR